MPEVGSRRWTIPEGYIPSASTGPEPEMTSHETACVLNTSDRDATLLVSGVPVVVQHTRLDSRQAENALLSSIAHPA